MALKETSELNLQLSIKRVSGFLPTFRDGALSTAYHCHNAAAWCRYVKIYPQGPA